MAIKLDTRSWVLIAVAGWALACALIALTGFGGRYRLLADDPTLAPRLPNVSHADTRSSLGPLSAYAEAANRPLFYPDRKPIAVHVPGQKSDAKPLDAILTSVIITPAMQMAIVQDNQTKESLRVREGQPLGGSYSGWKLVGLTPRSAVFDGGSQGQTTLNLRVFDGHGGEEPTRMGLTPQAVASGVLGAAHAPVDTDNQPDANPPAQSGDVPDVAAQAANAAAQAAQQAEQIRRRIEERRRQAQAEADNTLPPNDKVK